MLEQLQAGLSAGFNHLSRANYHNKDSIRGRYGRDYWDNTFTGTQFISVLENELARMPDNLVLEMLQSEDDLQDDEVQKQEKDDKTLRKRNTHQDKNTTETNPTKKLVDPITMFGGVLSIPSSLRQSQSSFKGSIEVIVKLVNCRRRLNSLISNVDEL